MSVLDLSELVQDGTLSVADAQQFSGLGRSFLYDLMTDGTLPFLKMGSRRLIPKRALVRVLADRLAAGQGEGE